MLSLLTSVKLKKRPMPPAIFTAWFTGSCKAPQQLLHVHCSSPDGAEVVLLVTFAETGSQQAGRPPGLLAAVLQHSSWLREEKATNQWVHQLTEINCQQGSPNQLWSTHCTHCTWQENLNPVTIFKPQHLMWCVTAKLDPMLLYYAFWCMTK